MLVDLHILDKCFDQYKNPKIFDYQSKLILNILFFVHHPFGSVGLLGAVVLLVVVTILLTIVLRVVVVLRVLWFGLHHLPLLIVVLVLAMVVVLLVDRVDDVYEGVVVVVVVVKVGVVPV